MNQTTVISLLTNSGLNNVSIADGFVYFQDPSCIFPAFDTVFHFAWIVMMIFTIIMLFGWGALYIKNGININTVFNNAKTLILIFCIFALTKPIVNVIYGDNLFSRQCDTKRVSWTTVQDLIRTREEHYGRDANFEFFNVIDSLSMTGVNTSPNAQTMTYANSNYSTANMAATTNSYALGVSGGVYATSNTGTSLGLLNNANIQSVEYHSGETIYVLLNGTKISRSGGSVSWRNNNPGNIIKSEFALKNGAVGSTDRWAVFPNEETGLSAMKKLLQSKNYVSLSIQGAINRWAPSSDGNNPVKYAQFVAKTAGLSVDARIQDLSDDDLNKMVRAMQKMEGWIPGIEKEI